MRKEQADEGFLSELVNGAARSCSKDAPSVTGIPMRCLTGSSGAQVRKAGMQNGGVVHLWRALDPLLPLQCPRFPSFLEEHQIRWWRRAGVWSSAGRRPEGQDEVNVLYRGGLGARLGAGSKLRRLRTGAAAWGRPETQIPKQAGAAVASGDKAGSHLGTTRGGAQWFWPRTGARARPLPAGNEDHVDRDARSWGRRGGRGHQGVPGPVPPRKPSAAEI